MYTTVQRSEQHERASFSPSPVVRRQWAGLVLDGLAAVAPSDAGHVVPPASARSASHLSSSVRHWRGFFGLAVTGG
jgi:hypothetical protein